MSVNTVDTVTLGTILEGTHVPLKKWLIACLLFSACERITAVELQRVLELGSYSTALSMIRRLRSAIPQRSPDRSFNESLRELFQKLLMEQKSNVSE